MFSKLKSFDFIIFLTKFSRLRNILKISWKLKKKIGYPSTEVAFLNHFVCVVLHKNLLLLVPWRGLRDQLTFVYHNLEAAASASPKRTAPARVLLTTQWSNPKGQTAQTQNCMILQNFKSSSKRLGKIWEILFLLFWGWSERVPRDLWCKIVCWCKT